MKTLVGIISDTHGLLRPEAVEALRRADLILHAGDIGSVAVIEGLQGLAPVVAVRGNCDVAPWADRYPLRRVVQVGQITILLVHDRKQVQEIPRGIRVVVAGHSHRPMVEEREGVLFLNPGSAGRRRFRLPVTVALLQVEAGDLSVEVVDLFPAPS
ncbi:MAG TPA: metallophosphoesterase family protein [Verrucomicrobiae bacterium]|nr:metallophosphoesterase family protein [Verrucomicrobiae bacterium]